jgi:Ran-binding protein 9/10
MLTVRKGDVFKDIKASNLYPSVGLKRTHEHLRANFGRHPFVFDIDKMMREERQIVKRSLENADLSHLHPPDDENALIHNLIGQYLVHEGYVETARAFGQDILAQQQSVYEEQRSFRAPDSDDDIHAMNRQKIRRAILDGDIDLALKYIHAFYPHVLNNEKNRDIDFRLKCRKFIEMMRRCCDVSSTNTSLPISKSADLLDGNGYVENGEDGHVPVDTQMELDDQLHREASKGLELPATDDIDMDISQELPPKSTFVKHQDLLDQVYEYGKELRSAYIGDTRPGVQQQLVEVFALLAYQDPANSVVGPLLEAKGRLQIAEEVNGAILGEYLTLRISCADMKILLMIALQCHLASLLQLPWKNSVHKPKFF